MKLQLDCLPCFLRQVLEASRMVTKKTEIQEKIIEEAIKILRDFKNYRTPPELAREIHGLVKIYTGDPDPYKEIKKQSIEIAKKFYKPLNEFLNQQEDKLYWGLKIAAIGNVLDYGVYSKINLERNLEKELKKEFALCDLENFKEKLKNAKIILILGDNAGETVFDKILIEEFKKYKIFYAVRGIPIINDATLEEAYESGLHECAEIISTGCTLPGIDFKECSKEFSEIFNQADIIISKGQGNYESLSDIKKDNLFFLLKVKCPVIASHIGIDVNNYVFKKQNIT